MTKLPEWFKNLSKEAQELLQESFDCDIAEEAWGILTSVNNIKFTNDIKFLESLIDPETLEELKSVPLKEFKLGAKGE